MNLNCDGTTLYPKKLQGAAINGTVLSINEIPDGSAASMIADISHELQKLRDIAHQLHLPNADKTKDHPHQIQHQHKKKSLIN